jgi:hypothetical protein
MMVTTEEAAAYLAERGVLIKGKGTELHPPSARSVEAWCRAGVLECEHVGVGKRGMWLVSKDVLETFVPPTMGRRPTE